MSEPYGSERDDECDMSYRGMDTDGFSVGACVDAGAPYIGNTGV